MTTKSKPTAATPEKTPEPEFPLVHSLSILAHEGTYQLVRLATRGTKVLGMVRESKAWDARYLAYIDFKVKSVKYFEDKTIFDAPLSSSLEKLPCGNFTALGIVRVHGMRFLPVSLRVSEDGSTVSATPLYSVPIYISDAFSLYKNRAEAIFVQNKLFLE